MARKRTYTIAEAAELVGLSRKAVARRVERGSLRSVVRDGRRLIPRSELVRTGLLPDEGREWGRDVDLAELPIPAATPAQQPDTALVGLVRELLERVERQATEIAQFRALTVQAESLRADRDLGELRARLAALENRTREDGPRQVAPHETMAHPGMRPATSRSSRSVPIWLPPGATPAPARANAAPGAPPVSDHAPAPGRAGPRKRGIVVGLEAAFIVAVAVIAGLAELRPLLILAAVALAWALVAAAEAFVWPWRRHNAQR